MTPTTITTTYHSNIIHNNMTTPEQRRCTIPDGRDHVLSTNGYLRINDILSAKAISQKNRRPVTTAVIITTVAKTSGITTKTTTILRTTATSTTSGDASEISA